MTFIQLNDGAKVRASAIPMVEVADSYETFRGVTVQPSLIVHFWDGGKRCFYYPTLEQAQAARDELIDTLERA